MQGKQCNDEAKQPQNTCQHHESTITNQLGQHERGTNELTCFIRKCWTGHLETGHTRVPLTCTFHGKQTTARWINDHKIHFSFGTYRIKHVLLYNNLTLNRVLTKEQRNATPIPTTLVITSQKKTCEPKHRFRFSAAPSSADFNGTLKYI